MKIWLVNAYAVPPKKGGANRHHSFAQLLNEMGHDVVIIAGSFDHFTKKQLVQIPAGRTWISTKEEGVGYSWIGTPKYETNGIGRAWNMLVFAFRLLKNWKAICEETGKPDVIVGSSLHLFGVAAAEWVSSRMKTGFVLEIRDIWPATLVELFGWSKIHPFVLVNRWLERRLYKRAAFIVSTMPLAESHFRLSGAKESSEIFWIPNGVRVNSEFIEKKSGSDNSFTLTYAGSLGDANGLDDLVGAVELLAQRPDLKHFSLQIVGDGPGRVGFEDCCVANGWDFVTFIGRVPKREIPAILEKSDAFVLMIPASPIYRWGYSMNKLSDYLNAARPIVIADVGPYNPVSEADAGFSYKAGDPSSLADAIARLVATPREKRNEMGRRGQVHARKFFNLEKLAQQYELVLRKASHEGS